MAKFDVLSFYGRENEELQKEYKRRFCNMTEKEKRLLLIDLSARLPYKPHVRIQDRDADLDIDAVLNGTYLHDWITLPSCQNMVITPYLRPMSSMTKEELSLRSKGFKSGYEYYDWLNANHFDYRGLIPMGLALEAKNGMYE